MKKHCTVGACIGMLLFHCASLRSEGIPEPYVTIYGVVTNVTASGQVRLTEGALAWRFQPSDGTAPVVISASLTNINDQFCYILQVPCESPVAGFLLSSNTLKIVNPAVSYNWSSITIDGVVAKPVFFSQNGISMTPSARGIVERVDLFVSNNYADIDGNGLPDNWEYANFGRLGNDPNSDPTHKGMTLRQQYIAGLNPNDPQSVFAFIRIFQHPAGGFEVDWASQTNKSYSLWRSPVLSTNAASYALVQSNLVATPPANSFRDTTVTGSAQFFYRVRVDQ